MDTRFRTWNVRSLYRAGSLMTVSKEQKKRPDGRVATLNYQENTHFSTEQEMGIMN
jgi:hypothetical protein